MAKKGHYYVGTRRYSKKRIHKIPMRRVKGLKYYQFHNSGRRKHDKLKAWIPHDGTRYLEYFK